MASKHRAVVICWGEVAGCKKMVQSRSDVGFLWIRILACRLLAQECTLAAIPKVDTTVVCLPSTLHHFFNFDE